MGSFPVTMMIRDNKEQANVDRKSVYDLHNTFGFGMT